MLDGYKGATYDWEQRKLGDYAEILTGGTPKTSVFEYWEPKKIPWMSSGEVNKRRLDETDNMISEEGLNNSSARWVKEYSVLIALAGQGKTRGTVAINNIPLTTNQSIAAIIPDETLHYEFIFQNLTKRYEELRMISSGDGTRGGLNKQIVSDIAIPFINIEEQQKIGTFFKQLDNTITLLQRKLDKLKQLKQGFLQQMFPQNGENVPRLRFANFEGKWEQRKLGELAVFSKGNGYTKSDLTSSGTPIILYGRLYTNYETVIEKVNTFAIKNNNSILSGGNEVIVPASGETAEAISRASVVASVGILLGGDLNIIKPNGDLDSVFLALTISNGSQQKELSKRAQGKSVVHLHNSDLKETDLLLPQKEEQAQISRLIKRFEIAISLLETKLDKLQYLKRGYMQKMFF